MPDRRLHVLMIAPNSGEFGGVEAVMLRIADLVADAEDVDGVICFKRMANFRMQPGFEDALSESKLPVRFVDRGSVGLLRAIAGADVVHSHNASIDIAVICKLLRKPHAITLHGWRRPGVSKHLLTTGAAARLADRHWYNSDFVWSTWEGERPRRTSEKLPIVTFLPQDPVPPESRKGFIFVGRWVPGKGLETLVDAYASADIDRAEHPLTLVGDGPLRPQILGRLVERGLGDVRTPGFVDTDTRNDLIRSSRWMVTPPHTNEELGLTPIEARSVGVPCIVTRDGGLLEAGGSFALHCAPSNVGELRRLIEFAARMEPDAYAAISAATRTELQAYLRPLSLYLERYRELA